ncbi:REP-associated tyrosine transposase [Oribacterium sp. NK2B42]|uniref:REP-associated tyrosine transposase n=1 Tax=Oribacterium sp. NK2B42 TaxID=689781 RepID=UPI000400DBDF|nr:transposase [Oribacterium sp. NK2B42]
MSRKKRIWYPGASYHVMSRGNRRTVLFKDASDYIRFLGCIESSKERYGFKVHSICLMTNHFHMIIETEKTDLSKIMQKILHPYSMDFNHKYDFTGHLFESRYTSCLIEDERYFLEVSRYIHLNPVKAQMVRGPLDYEYSSYGLYVDGKHERKRKTDVMIDELVDTGRVLDCFRNNSREQYRMFVEGKISHAEQEMLIQKDMKEDDMWLPW